MRVQLLIFCAGTIGVASDVIETAGRAAHGDWPATENATRSLISWKTKPQG